MEGCGEGRKQGGVSRKGNWGGRDAGLRQRDPPSEKDINLSHTEREQSTDLSEELEAFGFGFGFEQNQEIKRMGQSEKEKKSTTTNCGGGGGDEQGGRARSFWP